MLAVGWIRRTAEILWQVASRGNGSVIEYKLLDLTSWMGEIRVCGLSERICVGRMWTVGSHK